MILTNMKKKLPVVGFEPRTLDAGCSHKSENLLGRVEILLLAMVLFLRLTYSAHKTRVHVVEWWTFLGMVTYTKHNKSFKYNRKQLNSLIPAHPSTTKSMT